MGFKLVILWTDVALWALVAALAGYALHVRRAPQLRANWARVLQDPAALAAGLVLLLFVGVTLLDSVHFRSGLPPAPATASARHAAAPPAEGADGGVSYDARTRSLLDLVLARQIAMRETSYSAPLAVRALAQEPLVVDGRSTRGYPRLRHGGAHLGADAGARREDVIRRAAAGLAGGLAVFALLVGAAGLLLRRGHGGLAGALRALAGGRTALPLRALAGTLLVLCLLGGPVLALMGHYHVLGTDRTGNDVLLLALKSVRTAFVIGSLSTLATLPLALGLGIVAGYLGGWVDEVVQYLYTTLSSVPSVLLIAACVLMVQVFLDKNSELFETGVERADVKTLLLCAVLGLTGWAGLCRLVRAETLKLRELEYVQAATAFGVGTLRIMGRHIAPNVMHLVLITTVLGFSELILYEAVLTYVGVGVDPSTSSFGGMINLARNEMGRDPVVWWSFGAAFFFMVSLVLAANLFADAIRDAFDPRARSFRARLARRPAP